MSTNRIPTLREHATGVWIASWGGKTWYFTKDKRASMRAFTDPESDHPGSLARWQAWRAAKIENKSRTDATRSLRVYEVVAGFLNHYAAEHRRDDEQYYKSALRRFVLGLGQFYAYEITEQALDAYRISLLNPKLKLAPGTIAHALRAVKTLWKWGSSPARRLCPPLQLDCLKPPRVRRSDPEPMAIPEIKVAIDQVSAEHPWLRAWLSLNYLAALRPSEVVRLAYGQGVLQSIMPDDAHPEEIPDGVIELREHKMANRTAHSRFIPLSEAALRWYRVLTPIPRQRRRASRHGPEGSIHVRSLQNRYAELCRASGQPSLPHRLRDSAATHLRSRRVSGEDVDLILGHEPSSELPRYGRASIRLLRELVSRISLP